MGLTIKGSSFASHIPSHPYRWAEKYLHRYVHLKLLHSLNSSELELFRTILSYTVSGYSATRLHWDRLMFTPSGAHWLNGVFKEHTQEGLFLTQQSLKGKALKRGVGSETGEKGASTNSWSSHHHHPQRRKHTLEALICVAYQHWEGLSAPQGLTWDACRLSLESVVAS